MPNRPVSPLYTQVDASPAQITSNEGALTRGQESLEQTKILRDVLRALDRQNELMEELISQVGANQRQRNQELNHWRTTNPELSTHCRKAAEALSKVQTEFLRALTEEATENAEAMTDGEFLLAEFVDRYGPRLAHLNGVMQVLAQLGTTPNNK